jgi:hypothetical protein
MGKAFHGVLNNQTHVTEPRCLEMGSILLFYPDEKIVLHGYPSKMIYSILAAQSNPDAINFLFLR